MDIKTQVPIRPSSSDLWFLAYLPLAISDGIATPLIPLLALQHFGATAFAVTIIIGASAMSQVPFTILWGNLSDRIAHRKYFLVGSFLATGVSIIFIALAHDLVTYFWFNVVEGLASAASAPIGTMLLLETRHKRWWPQDIGFFGVISGLGTTIGLAVGFLWLFGVGHGASNIIAVMTSLLLVSGALALLSAAIAWAWIEEPAGRIERKSVADLLNLHRGVLERVRHFRSRVLNLVELTRSPADRISRKEWLFLISLAVMTVGFDIFYGPFPVFLWQTARFTDASVFIVYLGASAASTALFFHSGKAVERHSPKLVFLESLWSRVLLMLLFLWGPIYLLFGLGTPALLGWVTLLNGLMGVTWAFISTASTLFLIRLVGRASRGRALGLYNAVAGAGGLFGTLLGGWLFVAVGVHMAYLIAALTVFVGMLLLAPIPYHAFAIPHGLSRRPPLRTARAAASLPGKWRPRRARSRPATRDADSVMATGWAPTPRAPAHAGTTPRGGRP